MIRSLFGPVFILAGLNHFISPRFYLRIMPPWLPGARGDERRQRRRGDRRRRRRHLPGPARAAFRRLVLDRDARRGLPGQLAHGPPPRGLPRGSRRPRRRCSRGCRCSSCSSRGRWPRCGRRPATERLTPRRAGGRRASASRRAATIRTSTSGARLAAKRAKRCGGSVERDRPHAVQRDRVERPPVDRDGEPRAQQRGRLRGAPRVHVAGAQRRPPPPDGEQRDIERRVAPEARHLVEDVGVAGKVDAGGPLDDEADAGRRAGRRTDRGGRRGRPAPRGPARRSARRSPRRRPRGRP